MFKHGIVKRFEDEDEKEELFLILMNIFIALEERRMANIIMKNESNSRENFLPQRLVFQGNWYLDGLMNSRENSLAILQIERLELI